MMVLTTGYKQSAGETDPAITGVKLDQTELTLAAEKAAVLKAMVEPADTAVQMVTWSAEPEGVVTLKADGNSCTVTPVKKRHGNSDSRCRWRAEGVCTVTSGISIEDSLFIAKAEEGAMSADQEPITISWEKNEDGTVPLTAANLEKIEALTSLALPTDLYPQTDFLNGLQWFTGLEQLSIGIKEKTGDHP